MTLGEAIREVWPTMRRDPPPTTVAELKRSGSTYSGFGARTEDDRWGVHVMFMPSTVRASLTDHETLDRWGHSTHVDGGEFTHREFLELIAEPAQRSLFDEPAQRSLFDEAAS